MPTDIEGVGLRVTHHKYLRRGQPFRKVLQHYSPEHSVLQHGRRV